MTIVSNLPIILGNTFVTMGTAAIPDAAIKLFSNTTENFIMSSDLARSSMVIGASTAVAMAVLKQKDEVAYSAKVGVLISSAAVLLKSHLVNVHVANAAALALSISTVFLTKRVEYALVTTLLASPFILQSLESVMTQKV